MGLYLNPGRKPGQLAGPLRKRELLIHEHGASPTSMPEAINEVPESKLLICVVEMPQWEAALIVYGQDELNRVRSSKEHGDDRPTTWFLMDREIVLGLLNEEERAKLLSYECRS